MRPDWMLQAACRGQGFDDYFGQFKGVGTCDGCPVRADCLAYAVADRRLEGLWGGTTTAERAATRKRRVAQRVPPIASEDVGAGAGAAAR